MEQSQKLTFGVFAFTLAAILLIVGVVYGTVCIVRGHESVYSAYVYSKDNELYAVHEGKSVKLSSSAVDDSYLTKMSVYADTVSAAEILNTTKTYTVSQNGRYIYYLENFNPEKACGDLYRIEKGKPSSKVKISGSVNNSLVLSKKGDTVLFLCSTDENGNMGVLYFWKKGLREPCKITTDIDSGTFCFSAESKTAMYIQNLDRQIMQGDLYTQNLVKTKEERVRLDSGVCRIFGTTHDSKYFIYGKNYDVNDKSFEIFSTGGKNGLTKLSERTRNNPIIREKENYVYALEADNDGTNTICRISVRNGKKEKLASGAGSIHGISKNGKILLFDKPYDNQTADFYTFTPGKQPQKTAESIAANVDNVHDTPQFAYTSNLKTFVGISDYSADRGGTLIRTKFGHEPETLAENVHSCYLGENGKIIYTKDFNEERGTADVYYVNDEKTILLKKEISPSMLAADKACEKIFCITDYDAETASGTLETVNSNADATAIDRNVFGLDSADNGDLFFYKNLDTDNGGSFEFCLLRGGKTEKIVLDKGVQTIGTK